MEVYQFRYATESNAARLAAIRICPDELGMLKRNLNDFRDSVRERDLVAMAQLDFEFHHLVMQCAGNRMFADLYGSYDSVLLESQRLPLTRHRRLWEPVSEHENVVQAIERQDPDGACYFMRVQILRAADRVGVPLSDKARLWHRTSGCPGPGVIPRAMDGYLAIKTETRQGEANGKADLLCFRRRY